MLQITAQERADLGRMNGWRIAAICVLIVLNALDGFDVMSISFAAPLIARDWQLRPDALGLVLSMELVGMAIGSIALGGVADRVGRRPVIAACLTMTAIGMASASFASSLPQLCLARIVTGIGVGGLLTAVSALVAELSNKRWRNLSLSLMLVGLPIGAILGGMASKLILQSGEWRGIFLLGAIIATVFIPIFLLLVPESLAILTKSRKPDALARINATLRRFGVAPMPSLPISKVDQAKPALAIFSRRFLPILVLVMFAYISHVTCYYFFTKWAPKLVTDMGFSAAASADVLVSTMVGCAVGGVAFGILATFFDVRRLTMSLLVGSAIAVSSFGHARPEYTMLLALSAVSGFFMSSAMIGFYVILTRELPASLRASGIGIVTGTGRAASALGPSGGGFLLGHGVSVGGTVMVMAAGSLVSVALIFLLRTLANRGTDLKSA